MGDPAYSLREDLIMKCKILCLLALFAMAVILGCANPVEVKSETSASEKLVIIWSSADRDVALNMVFMYASNSIGSWDDITLVVWAHPPNSLQEIRSYRNI